MLEIDPVVTIRPFETTDIPAAYALSSSFGWPQRLEDHQWFASLGRGFVAIHDANLVGTAMHWDYDNGISSIGAVMVEPRMQGCGIGKRLTVACLGELQGRSIILHATPAGQPLYEQYGFVAGGLVHQHQGIVRQGLIEASSEGLIVPLTPDYAAAVIELAQQGSGLERPDLLASLLVMSDGVVLLKDGRPSGIALFRRYCSGWAIGPVVAPNEEAAEALISYWLTRNTGQFVRIDLTQQSSERLRSSLNSAGLDASATATVMVRGRSPESRDNVRQFAIVTQATG